MERYTYVEELAELQERLDENIGAAKMWEKRYHDLVAGQHDMDYDELMRGAALVNAQAAGRVVVLPEQAIAARYDVADMLDDFRKDMEFDDPSVGIYGITWAESDLLHAIIDGLNVGCAEAEAALSGGAE